MDSKYRKEIRFSGFLEVPVKNNDCFRGFKKLSGFSRVPAKKQLFRFVGFRRKSSGFTNYSTEKENGGDQHDICWRLDAQCAQDSEKSET